jgi:hypothetical protein
MNFGMALLMMLMVAGDVGAQSGSPPAAPQPGQLHIVSQPDGAAIALDGKPRGVTPLTLVDTAPGKHLIELTKRDLRTVRRTVVLAPGARMTEEFRLEPLLGLAIVHSDPPAIDVRIDGIDRGQTPLLLTDLALGRHRLQLSKPGYIAKEVELVVKDASPIRQDFKLTPDFGTLHVESDPPGAEVQLNGVARGATPISIERVPTGESTLRLELDGFEPYLDTLKLAAGETQTIPVTMQAIPSTLRIVSIPAGARIYFDNQFKGAAPVQLDNLPPGVYRVRAELPLHDLLIRSIMIGRAANIVEEFRLQPNSGAIEITTEPADVKVFVDGKECGTTPIKEGATDRVSSEPLRIDAIAGGMRELRFVKPGYHETVEQVNILRDQTVVKHVRLARRFIPNCEVITDGEVYRGVLIEVDAAGNVRLELRPGIMKTILRQDIRRRRPLREIDPAVNPAAAP